MRWIEPVAADGTDDAPLSAAHVRAWRDSGAVVVDGLLPLDLILEGRAAARSAFAPPVGDGPADFGSGGSYVFPAEVAAVNELTLHPRLLVAVAQLLGCAVRELRLSQSDLWAKFGRSKPIDDPVDNADQRMHVDYPNHTLLHPPLWAEPDAVEMIVYADGVEECAGATAVVLREGDGDPAYPWPIVGTPGVAGLPWINDRSSAESYLGEHAPELAAWRAEHLYARERHVRYRPGTVLLYRHDTWHRGTPIRPGALRIVQNLTFRRAATEWISTLHEGWAWAMYRSANTMERIIATSSVDQRCVLGFPPPGHAVWTEPMLQAVDARYAPYGMDISPYRDAAQAGS